MNNSGKHKADGFKLVGSIADFCSAAPILAVGNSVDLAHPFGIISDFRVYGAKIPEYVLSSPAAPFNESPDDLTVSNSASGAVGKAADAQSNRRMSRQDGGSENAEELARWQDLFSKFDEDGDGFLREEEFGRALALSDTQFTDDMVARLYSAVVSGPTAGIALSDLAHWLRPKQAQPSKDPAWAYLPETFVARSLGANASGVVAALIGATRRGVQEVSFWSCSALGNLATARQNRVKIICQGGMGALLGPCNSKNPALAVEAARALVMLR